MQSPALRIGAFLVLVALLLAGADWYFKERPQQIAVEQQNAIAGTEPVNAVRSSAAAVTASGAGFTSSAMSMSSGPVVVKKGVSTKKKTSVDIHALLASLQFIPVQTSEASLLQLLTKGVNVETVVLLQNNDRSALFSWIESGDTKIIFASLKQALQEQFSPKLSGLVDETRNSDNGPPVDMLSFTDPAISPEAIIFIRVRDRLYEFHITEKGTEAVSGLIAELSK